MSMFYDLWFPNFLGKISFCFGSYLDSNRLKFFHKSSENANDAITNKVWKTLVLPFLDETVLWLVIWELSRNIFLCFGSFTDSHTSKFFNIVRECLKFDKKLTFKVWKTFVHPFCRWVNFMTCDLWTFYETFPCVSGHIQTLTHPNSLQFSVSA